MAISRTHYTLGKFYWNARNNSWSNVLNKLNVHRNVTTASTPSVGSLKLGDLTFVQLSKH